MATLSVEQSRYRNEMCLAVAPDWVLGADEHNYFVGSTATTGTMDVWHYTEGDIKELIEFLSNKVIGKYEADIFKYILFELYALLKGGGNISEVLNRDIENFTYVIKTYQPDNLITRKINYYLPPTKSHKQKLHVLYLIITLQHVICEKVGRLDLRIPTVLQS